MSLRWSPLLAPILLLGLLVDSVQSQAPAIPQATVSAAVVPPTLTPGSPAELVLTIAIPEGLHAQSAKPLDPQLIPLSVNPTPMPGVTFPGPVRYPEGEIVTYPALGTISVYEGTIAVALPITVASDVQSPSLTIAGTVRLQLCNDTTCFRPQNLPFSVTLPVAVESAVPGVVVSADLPQSVNSAVSSGSESARGQLFGYEIDLVRAGPAVTLLLAFLVGIIFNVMPCVLPVLPLKAVGFYEASHHRRGRTLLFGLSFAVGVVAVFFVLALLVLAGKSLLGHDFQWGQQFSYGWFVWGMAILLTVLAMGIMGAFTVNLPTAVYGLSFRHDTIPGNFLWGGLTAVLSTPCTAPLFPAILAWAVGQPRVWGVLAVLMVGVGMASPYVVLSAFPELARRFPRTGPVSELIKQMMGFLLLATAAFFVGIRVMDGPSHWWLVFGVICWGVLYLVVRTMQLTQKPVALYLTTAAAVGVVGLSLVTTLRLTEELGGWTPYSAEVLEAARSEGRPVLVKFTADWCLNCQYVEQTVFHNRQTLAALEERNVKLIKADLSDEDAPGWALLNELGQSGIPFTAVYLPGQTQPSTLASVYTSKSLLAIFDSRVEAAGDPATPSSPRNPS